MNTLKACESAGVSRNSIKLLRSPLNVPAQNPTQSETFMTSRHSRVRISPKSVKTQHIVRKMHSLEFSGESTSYCKKCCIMCLKRASMKSLSHLAIIPNLRHNVLSSFSQSRHRSFAKIRLLHTLIPPTRSLFVASQATAHSEKFVCWINRKLFSVLSRVAIKRRTENYSENLRLNSKDCRKMVWISNIDNPKVNDHFSLDKK